jgi:hypothetical protein
MKHNVVETRYVGEFLSWCLGNSHAKNGSMQLQIVLRNSPYYRQFRADLNAIFGAQSGAGQISPLQILIQPAAPNSSPIILGWYQ